MILRSDHTKRAFLEAEIFDLMDSHEPEKSTILGPSIKRCVDEGRDVLPKSMVQLCAMEGLRHLKSGAHDKNDKATPETSVKYW